MLPSSQKLDGKLFKLLLQKGRSFHDKDFSIRIFLAGLPEPARFSVVVSRKVEKSAVKRNSLKRRFYALIRPIAKKSRPGALAAIFIKKQFGREELKNIIPRIELALKKAGARAV